MSKKQRRLFWFRGANSRNHSLEILERKGVRCKAKGPVIRFLQESTIHHSFSPLPVCLCLCGCDGLTVLVLLLVQYWLVVNKIKTQVRRELNTKAWRRIEEHIYELMLTLFMEAVERSPWRKDSTQTYFHLSCKVLVRIFFICIISKGVLIKHKYHSLIQGGTPCNLPPFSEINCDEFLCPCLSST